MDKILEKLKKIKIEDLLCLFIVLCPVLDILSFIFRNIFNTNISPSTFIRPIIPIIAIVYIFLKESKRTKKYILLVRIYIYNVFYYTSIYV